MVWFYFKGNAEKTQETLPLQLTKFVRFLTSLGNGDKKLCVCEAVEMCCVDWGFVVCSSSWRRSAKPLLHSFHGSNPKNGKGKSFDYYFIISYLFYVLLLLSDFLISSVIMLLKRTTLNSEQPVWLHEALARNTSWEIKLEETRLLQFSVQKTWPAIKFHV